MSKYGVKINVMSAMQGATLTIKDANGANAETYVLMFPGPSPDEFSYGSNALPANSDPFVRPCGYQNPPVGYTVIIDNEAMIVTDRVDDSHVTLSRAAYGTTAAAHEYGAPTRFCAAPASGQVGVVTTVEDRATPLQAKIAANTSKALTYTIDTLVGCALWLWADEPLQVEATGGIELSSAVLEVADLSTVIAVTDEGLPGAVNVGFPVGALVSAEDATTGDPIDLGTCSFDGAVVTHTPADPGARRVRVGLVAA